MSDLSNLLNAYGFSKKDCHYIIQLLYLAGCFEEKTLKADLSASGHSQLQIDTAIKIVQQAKKNAPQELDFQLLVDKLFFDVPKTIEQGAWPEKIHSWLIRVTQREFFARAPGQERWQQSTGKWITENESQVRELVDKKLELTNVVLPQQKNYQAILVLGATYPIMEKRIEYLRNLLVDKTINPAPIYLLSGERQANQQADTQQAIKQTADKYDISTQQVTEAELIQYAFDKVSHDDKILSSFKPILINTPKGKLTRPTTKTTLLKWLKDTESLNISGDILCISLAPNIFSQHEDILMILRELSPNIKPETVGDTYLQSPLNRSIGAFAGRLYGGYPRVAMELGSNKGLTALKESRLAHNYNSQLIEKEAEVTSEMSLQTI